MIQPKQLKMGNGNWTRDQLILAFNLYCKTPFGKIHFRNPQIIELAKVLGRTPSAVAWKLANFAHLDESLRARHIVGAAHVSTADRHIWEEFTGDWEHLAFESERLMAAVKRPSGPTEADVLPEGKTREKLVRVRVNQAFFRCAVLAAYNTACCITGLSITELLTASHIVPWAVDEDNRTNPRNGLCLNAIHDRAFDCGLLTVTPQYKVRISPAVSKNTDIPTREFLLRYDGKRIVLPDRFLPDIKFLAFHNDAVFRAA